MSKFHELIYYSEEQEYPCGNFSGKKSLLTNKDRLEFLDHYYSAAREWYNLEDNSKKAATEQEIDDTLKSLKRHCFHGSNIIAFEKMQAYKRPKKSGYKGWQFYTRGAEVLRDTLHFADADTAPLPAAKFEFYAGNYVKSLEFEFFVDREYFSEIIPYPLTTTTTSRVIELRRGIEEYAKIHIYCNGDLAFRDCSSVQYHLNISTLAKNVIGDKHRLKIIFIQNSCNIYLDGNLVGENFPLPKTEKPIDTIFFGGGMHPRGKWSVKPLVLQTDQHTITEFFIKENRVNNDEVYIGEVDLPYVIGTQLNKDYELILRKNIDVTSTKGATLNIESIDPCGEIIINGKNIGYISSPMSQQINIENCLAIGENTIEIIVFPRAPEVLFSWHRHIDPYNGWFFLGASILFFNNVQLQEIKVSTLNITDNEIDFNLNMLVNAKMQAKAELWLKKIYPVDGKSECIGSFNIGEGIAFYLSKSFRAKADKWSVEAPVIYKLSIRLFDSKDSFFDEFYVETGFRTIKQQDGTILLNEDKTFLSGALLMQFLPPHEQVPLNHVCPDDRQIVMQMLYAKKMNCNVLRMHQLGYGSNDKRFAYYADRMGIMLIWTTRLIDSLETIVWDGEWRQASAYKKQMLDVINSPSIIMWEGSNEFHGTLKDIDKMYDTFVDVVKSIDVSRLICPCSHMYYGGGIYDIGCKYFQEDGLEDESFNKAPSSYGWRDESVVRSAHTYALLLGYGADWERYRLQDWPAQQAMLDSKKHAYLITEFAVIGRQDPHTEEAISFINKNSYELGNEKNALGEFIPDHLWHLSQAHQSLCAAHAVKRMRALGVDGMMWCCLTSGANNASYLKPTIDFFGYAKLAFYTLKEAFSQYCCVNNTTATHFDKTNFSIKPYVILNGKAFACNITITIQDSDKTVVDKKTYANIYADKNGVTLDEWKPKLQHSGYYSIITEIEKL